VVQAQFPLLSIKCYEDLLTLHREVMDFGGMMETYAAMHQVMVVWSAVFSASLAPRLCNLLGDRAILELSRKHALNWDPRPGVCR
jgi:hypothetical protein